jgi:hypothetical protein
MYENVDTYFAQNQEQKNLGKKSPVAGLSKLERRTVFFFYFCLLASLHKTLCAFISHTKSRREKRAFHTTPREQGKPEHLFSSGFSFFMWENVI